MDFWSNSYDYEEKKFKSTLVVIHVKFNTTNKDTIDRCHGHMIHTFKSLSYVLMCTILEGCCNLDANVRGTLSIAKVLIGEPQEKLLASLKAPKYEFIAMVETIFR